eukprot:g39332.t1
MMHFAVLQLDWIVTAHAPPHKCVSLGPGRHLMSTTGAEDFQEGERAVLAALEISPDGVPEDDQPHKHEWPLERASSNDSTLQGSSSTAAAAADTWRDSIAKGRSARKSTLCPCIIAVVSMESFKDPTGRGKGLKGYTLQLIPRKKSDWGKIGLREDDVLDGTGKLPLLEYHGDEIIRNVPVVMSTTQCSAHD